MKKACLYVNSHFIKDEVFNADNKALNRDNQGEPFRALKAAFREKGYDLRTQDLNPPSESEVVIYIDMPEELPEKDATDRSYLVLFETDLIRPDNWSRKKHQRFKKVFTWSEQHLRESDRYVKTNFPQPMPWPVVRKSYQERKKLCCMVAGGKLSVHPKELYSERIRWIKWFEKNHPDQFDLYGAGWKKMWMTGPLWVRAVNKLPLWRKILYPGFSSYKGPIDDKINGMAAYRFAICLENGKDIEGYITEKIFDCFFAGCIPLYWGAPDITEKIPSDCFIDLREFKTHEAAYERISKMTEVEFNGYLQRIDAFLQSAKMEPFMSRHFVKTLVENCVDR